MKETSPPRVWYKNPILWLIIAIPCWSLISGISMLYFAISTKQAPVLDTYYKEGLSPHKRAQAPNDAQISAKLEGGVLRTHALAPNDVLQLTLEHPTIASQDTHYTLNPIQSNLYSLPPEAQTQLRKHHWYLRLTPADKRWTMRGQYDPYTPNAPIVFAWR